MGTCTSRSPGLSGRACIITNGAKASANGNAAGGDDGNCIWYACSQGEPRHAHGEGGRVQLRDDLLRAADGGKVPFEDNHLQGDKKDEQECPRWRVAALFLFSTPKYLVAMTKRCWHADPAQHPSFATSPPFAASFGT